MSFAYPLPRDVVPIGQSPVPGGGKTLVPSQVDRQMLPMEYKRIDPEYLVTPDPYPWFLPRMWRSGMPGDNLDCEFASSSVDGDVDSIHEVV